MARGLSRRVFPYRRTIPSWNKLSGDDVISHITRLARKGLRPSRICTILRDCYGIGQSCRITEHKVLRLLKCKGLAPSIPEDLHSLMVKATSIRQHLLTNRNDTAAKYRLILMEGRLLRLIRHFKSTRSIPANFRYDKATAASFVSA